MEKIGVMAVVEGLSKFLGDIGKMDEKIRSLIPGNSLLEKAFLAVGDTIKGFASSALRTLEYAFGQLLADAIKGVISLLGDLVTGVMDSADQFGKLQIRLERLNFNDAKRSGMEYNEALKESVRLTQEQINWTLKLGLATPYSPADIANIYTLARGYGFSADEAKTLTEAVIEFTSGMGLSNTELERIIINFGQLSQQGKLNGQDIRDLARGAYVPVNRVLDATAEKLGMTRDEFNKARLAGKIGAEGVDAFRQAFVDLVGVDFEGAAEALGDIFSVAVENVKEFLENSIGLKVVLPVLTLIGTKINAITQELANNESLWAKVSGALDVVGGVIMRVVEELMGFLPSTESLANSIADVFNNIALWFLEHEDDIISWVRDAVDWMENTLIPTLTKVWEWLFGGEGEEKGAIAGFFDFIEKVGPGVLDLIDWIVTQLTTFSTWVNDNQGLINEFFTTLGEIVSDVLEGLFGQTPGEGEGFLGILKTIMQEVVNNKDSIASFVEGFVKLAIAWDVLKLVGGILLGILAPILVAIAVATDAVIMFGAGAVVLTGIILGLITAFFIFGDEIKAWGATAGKAVDDFVNGIIDKIHRWVQESTSSLRTWAANAGQAIDNAVYGFIDKIQMWLSKSLFSFSQWSLEVFAKISAINWGELGWNIIDGITGGLLSRGGVLIDTAVQLAMDAYNAITSALGIQSPSKLFMEVGYMIDEGLAAGILGMAKDVGNAMGTVMGQVTAPAFATASAPSRSVSNNQQYTQNYNLNINSGANQENIISDFEMLSSLAG